MRDIKYLLAYLPPILAIMGLSFQGSWVFVTVLFTFGLVPLLEIFSPQSRYNFSQTEISDRLSRRLFDYLLYLNIPIVYGILAYWIFVLNTQELALYEYVGLTLSVGIIFGASGINVGHELGHRKNSHERWMAKALLLPNLYVHFFIEHNRGHHKHVATDLDPASARFNEALYPFWVRSIIFSYISAWKLEAKRLRRLEKPVMSFQNEMLRLQLLQLAYIFLIGFLTTTWLAFGLVLLSGLIGVLLLETVNYIEHYGLRRKQLPSGAYERVRPIHSWNSNHELGRILLYELTRHSDHHYIASKKYQILDHHDHAPQLPFGYPTAMLTALLPPLWFRIMNKKVNQVQTQAV